MTPFNFFTNNAGRLRSGWRFLIFIVALIVVRFSLDAVISLVRAVLPQVARESIGALLAGGFGFIAQGLLLLVVAVALGWLLGRVLEDLPLRALGWARHRGWLRDLGLGSLVGAGSLLFAAALISVAGGYRFDLGTGGAPAIARTLLSSFVILMLGAASEEALFRGYPLQTLARSHPILLAALPISALFGVGHLSNPNVSYPWTFINTTLAGVWLALAYWRTRSLWFPLGVHWAWNWTMTAVLGIPVSGITEIAPTPLLKATEQGADWFTGGAYGVEGGAACTLALLLSSLFIWRMKSLAVSQEMRPFTSEQANHDLTGGNTSAPREG